ncbi:MAG: hypothetical protein EZS28_021360 [Streblomastix strix]|uniref:NrS-1 polymerase-like helicase domain-containing protein n=1 Tax=Streblomastix strix TaxID=222440 RepID=A0A5J4VKK5_9EUKA|nr:MAG: hypothetical protein EZS28_021360 [Streblomastix strix]
MFGEDSINNELINQLLNGKTEPRTVSSYFIKWYEFIDAPPNLKLINTYESTKINSFNFKSNCFNEYILPDKYCHPYFDFDHIETQEQYTSVITWLDSLISEFGQYSIGGYSNDTEICIKNNLRFIQNAEKKISIHVVFYEKRILQADMMEIVKKVGNQITRRFCYDISEFVDDSVYKLKPVSNKSRQIFRHILSNKQFRQKEPILIAGQLCKQNDEPINQIVQCIQDDSSTDDVISNWGNVIHKIPSLKEKEKEKTNAKRLVDVDNGVAEVGGDGKIITKTKVKNIKIDDIDFDDNLIVFDKDQMMELLNKFETTFENLEKTTGSIRYSPHTDEFIKECYTDCKAFRYNEIIFQEKNKEGCINMFTGFAYKEIQTDDFTRIQPFLDHIKNVLAGKQVKLKIGTMMNFIGQQGCGKSFAIETIYELLGIFALKNVDELTKIFGKFNALASTAILINFNEISDATDSFNLQHKMKSAITQASGIIERKGIDSQESEIWSNFTCTCNDMNAIPAEKGNRRFQYFTCNNEFAGEREYFQNLCQDIQPQKQGEYNEEFMGILLHYFRTLDIQGFDAEDFIVQASRKTDVEYNEQLERQYTGLNQVDRYVVDNFPIFEIGVPIEGIKIEKYQIRGLAIKLKSSCEFIRTRNQKFIKYYYIKNKAIYDKYIKMDLNSLPEQVSVYSIKQEDQCRDLMNIIKYKQFNISASEGDEAETNPNQDDGSEYI